MNRKEFMRRLESLLQDIPEQERAEALQYYDDYFEDAGAENEARVIISLISPERVAENIKNDLNQNRNWNGYEEEKVEKGHEIAEYGYQREQENSYEVEPEKKGLPTGVVVLLVILGICALPIILGLLAAILGIVVGIGGVLLAVSVISWGIVIGAGAAFVALLLGALVCIVVGFFCMPFNTWVGLAVVGSGLIVAALGIFILLLTILLWKLAGFVISGLYKGIGKLFGMIFGRK